MSEYTPVTYVKGDDERVAKNASQAVALEFDGFKPKDFDQVTEAPSEDAPVDKPSEDQAPGDSVIAETPKPAAPKPQAPRNQEPVNP